MFIRYSSKYSQRAFLTFAVCAAQLISMAGCAPLTVDVLMRAPNCGASTSTGDTLSVHYTGSLTNGTVFDSR